MPWPGPDPLITRLARIEWNLVEAVLSRDLESTISKRDRLNATIRLKEVLENLIRWLNKEIVTLKEK